MQVSQEHVLLSSPSPSSLELEQSSQNGFIFLMKSIQIKEALNLNLVVDFLSEMI